VNRLGYLAVSLAAVLWAFGGTYARTLIDHGASPLEITEARAWIAVTGIGLLLAARRRTRRHRRPSTPRPVGTYVAFGLSIAAANYSYYRAIAALPVAVAIVVQYTAPALVVVWLALAQRERPPLRVVAALALAMIGVALLAELPHVLASGHTTLSTAGFVAAAVSAVAFSTYIVIGERIRSDTSPEDALFRGFLVAGIFWVCVQAFRGTPHTLLSARFALGIVVIGLVATIAPFLLFIWGLGHVSASRAGIVSTLEPLSAALLAYAWLHQTLTPSQLAGAAMVIAGVAIVQAEQTAAVPEPAPLE
jgi:drug/metabolite transporter (DMT)-like permease